MLNDSNLLKMYLIVDALNEYDSSLFQLLDTIAFFESDLFSWVKQLVVSYNKPDIEERLKSNSFYLKISLKLNLSYISYAINTFINFKIQELVEQKKYDNKLYKEVRSYLYKNTEETFL